MSRLTFSAVAKGGGFMKDGEGGSRGLANKTEADSIGSAGGGNWVEDGQEAKE